jgi:hypothetical protein
MDADTDFRRCRGSGFMSMSLVVDSSVSVDGSVSIVSDGHRPWRNVPCGEMDSSAWGGGSGCGCSMGVWVGGDLGGEEGTMAISASSDFCDSPTTMSFWLKRTFRPLVERLITSTLPCPNPDPNPDPRSRQVDSRDRSGEAGCAGAGVRTAPCARWSPMMRCTMLFRADLRGFLPPLLMLLLLLPLLLMLTPEKGSWAGGVGGVAPEGVGKGGGSSWVKRGERARAPRLLALPLAPALRESMGAGIGGSVRRRRQ